MKTVSLTQGSPEWNAHRAKHLNASDIPVVMGLSKYKTRTQLLHEKKTGIVPDVDGHTQRLFDEGHKVESTAREILERKTGEELYPVVAVAGICGLELGASLDGVNMFETWIFEHKLINEELRKVKSIDDLDKIYKVQMQQQLMVSDAEYCIFVASDGTENDWVEFKFEGSPELEKEIIAAWKQFLIDLEEYEPSPPSAPALTPSKPDQLPALFIQVTGEVTASNLDVFRERAVTVIDSINEDLETDQDFADAEAAIKFCQEVEKRIESTKDGVLGQTVTIDQLFKALYDVKELSRQKRLKLGKLVKSKKEEIKLKLVRQHIDALLAHINALNARLCGDYMPVIEADFPGAIRGLKSLDSMRDKLSVELANRKIQANEIADIIDANRKIIEASGHASLVPDFKSVCTKSPEDFQGLIAMRLQQREQEQIRERERQEEQRRQQEQRAREQQEQEQQAEQQGHYEMNGDDLSTRHYVPDPVLDEKPPMPEYIARAAVADIPKRIDIDAEKKAATEYLEGLDLAPRTLSTSKKHLHGFIEHRFGRD